MFWNLFQWGGNALFKGVDRVCSFGLYPEKTVASVAGAVTLPTGSNFQVTGANAVTSITPTYKGHIVLLEGRNGFTMVDGGNLKIAGDFTGAALNTITLKCDGTDWIELSRSVNA